jgi:hypothetical protein
VLLGLSFYKIYRAATFVDTNLYQDGNFPTILKEEKLVYAPKTEVIKTFLLNIWEHKSISLLEFDPGLQVPENSLVPTAKKRLAIGCYDSGELFLEFEKTNITNPVSYDWFHHVWKKFFPLLITAHDRGCHECDELLAKMREAEMKADFADYNGLKIQYEDHKKKSSSFYRYSRLIPCE